MLTVVSLEEAKSIVRECFDLAGALACEHVSLEEAAGRVLAEDVVAQEGIPPFDRSMMDGFAVRAADTFGCSESLPAILDLAGEVLMGAAPECSCLPGSCVRIPTGGQIPEGADAVVMLEYCEEYGDGTIGVTKPVAPAANIAFENDDVAPGQVIMRAGTRLRPHHVGTLASMGCCDVNVRARPRVGVISTGDEIVPVSATPKAAQMRDVNARWGRLPPVIPSCPTTTTHSLPKCPRRSGKTTSCSFPVGRQREPGTTPPQSCRSWASCSFTALP